MGEELFGGALHDAALPGGYFRAAALGFAVTLAASLALLATRGLHGRFTRDGSEGVQKLHCRPALRIGGLPVLIGAAAAGLALPGSASGLWWALIGAGLPAFLAGFAEDLSKAVGSRVRLAATLASGAIFVLATGLAIGPLGLPGADLLLALPAFAFGFTAFAIGGVANALNIVDGLHGLAAGAALAILAALGAVAHAAGDAELSGLIGIGFALTFGFFAVNFPRGTIFLGDSGAYLIGFLLAAFAVALPARNAELSPLIGLLALAYPVTETLVSIQRRLMRRGAAPGRADRLHLHSLVHARLAWPLARRQGRPDLANPLATLLLSPLPLAVAVLTVAAAARPDFTWPFLGLVVLVYIGFYRRLARLGPPRRAGGWRLPAGLPWRRAQAAG